MSTRSYIAMKRGGKYEGVYCHWDGYPEHNGNILNTYYKNPQNILELLNNGDLSILERKITPNSDLPHTFENPQRDVCLFYYRDRNEDKKYTSKKSFETIEDLLNSAKESWAEYIYIFEDNMWTFYSIGDDFSQRVILEDYLIKEAS